MRELDYQAIEARKNKMELENLILQNEAFILKSASIITRHYITKNDDEWSIALIAFVQAVKNYELEKGSFISFARLVIHRRLIDYIRNEVKYQQELSVDPIIFDTDSSVEEEEISIQAAVAQKVSQMEDDSIKLEINAINQVFSKYGFTFFDLTDCSPQAKKTKTACAKAIAYIIRKPILLKELRSTKQLPLKIIQKNIKVPRKLMERHRKYIIAAIEILSGEYPKLSEYLKFIREEI